MKLLNVPTYCDDVDLTVDIKQGQRLGPEWLSSPTRPDPLVFHKNEGGNTKRCKENTLEFNKIFYICEMCIVYF